MVRAEILHFFAAKVPVMRLNINGNNLIVFFCVRLFVFSIGYSILHPFGIRSIVLSVYVLEEKWVCSIQLNV